MDFIGDPISTEDISKSEELLKMNFGKEYRSEFFNMLWGLVKEDGWTNYRLRETIKWVLKNKRWQNLTIADFYDYKLELRPYHEYLEELHKDRTLNEQIEWYWVEDQKFWKYKDGTNLPLKKVGGKQ